MGDAVIFHFQLQLMMWCRFARASRPHGVKPLVNLFAISNLLAKTRFAVKIHDLHARGHLKVVAPLGGRMGTWRRLILHDGIHGFGQTDELRDAFIEAFVEAGEPVEMAVFRRHDVDKGVVILLFSPGASAFAERWDAKPCDKPESAHGLALLLGDDEAWPIYFPNCTRGPSTTW